MKNRLKGLAALAVIAGLASWALWQQSKPASAPQALPAWPAFDQSKAAEIVIAPPKRPTIRLQRRKDKGEGEWVLLPAKDEEQAEPANAEAVAHLLTDLAKMRIGRVVSHRAEHFPRLQLDDAHAVHLTIKDAKGDTILDLFVGKPASDLISTYVRRAGENLAVTVDKSLTWQLRRVRNSWRAADSKETNAKPEQTADKPAEDAAAQTPDADRQS